MEPVKFAPLAFAVILAGCATDLRTSGALSAEDARHAGRVAEAVQRKCTHHKYLEGPTRQKISGDMQFSELPQVRRLFTSPSGWTKAYVMGDNVWFNAYYHEATDRTVCGDEAWSANASTAGIYFTEVLPGGPAQPPLQPRQPPASRPLAVQWSSQGGLMAGFVTLRETGRTASVAITLPEGRGTCAGVSELGADGQGTWAVSCTNGATAAGTLRGLGSGKGSVGVGVDSSGGEVRFTMGPVAP